MNRLLAEEAKAIVALAFRNGPIENVHAGETCPTCDGKQEYSHITQAWMREIMKSAVDKVYQMLVLRDSDPERYAREIAFGSVYTRRWDDPEPLKPFVPTSRSRAAGRIEERSEDGER